MKNVCDERELLMVFVFVPVMYVVHAAKASVQDYLLIRTGAVS